MAYYITQIAGERHDQAQEYTRLRKISLASAQKYYLEITGEQGAPSESVWWLYNAADILASRNSITITDILSYRGRPFRAISEHDRARAECVLATRKHGGVWQIFYEY